MDLKAKEASELRDSPTISHRRSVLVYYYSAALDEKRTYLEWLYESGRYVLGQFSSSLFLLRKFIALDSCTIKTDIADFFEP